MAYAASKELRVGFLKEMGGSGDAENVWAVAAEYFHNSNLWFKGRINSLGVLSVFNRYILNPKWTLESFLETGLHANHRVNGIAGTNLFAGLKVIYNE